MIDSISKDTFRFVVPADLEKGKDGEWRIRGLASTERVDQQGETIIQKGMDLTPIDRKKGIINFDHQKGPENTIGLLDGYTRTEKGLHIEGRLFKNHTKAKAVREIMESLGAGDRGRVGLSVEGKILERDPLNPAIIKKCQISAVAVTLNPVNTDTYADIMKSMNSAQDLEISAEEQPTQSASDEAVFTASQVMAIVQKALSIGSSAVGAPDAKVGGAALSPSDLDSEECKEPLKKKKIKKMSKSLYKSNLVNVLDKLQILYPNNSRSEIWEAVRERLETKFEMAKGGPGSGVRGHQTTNAFNPHSGATSVHDHGNGKFTHTFLGEKPEEAASAIKRIKDSGATIHHEKPHVSYDGKKYPSIHFTPKMEKSEAVESDLDKGLRLKNTSGKEREHKLYEDARQRDDYERNKDKSRSELNQLAEESGASKHDKAKIRAQADAAIQAGEDRDHVRPNIKG